MVDRKKPTAHKSAIRKRTPLEQAIAEQTNPRARFDAKMEQRGFKRTTIWVHRDGLDKVKAFIREVNAQASEGSGHD